jgi:spore germination protein GerM
MDERNRGITTAIPKGTRLLSLTLMGRGRAVAIVNLAGLPPAQGRQGKEATTGQRVRVITQVARTLIGLSGIDGVEIRLAGKPWDLWTMDGRVVRTVTNYDRLGGWTRICGGRSRDERKLGVSRCFAALP